MLEKIHEYLAVPEGAQGVWFDMLLGYMFIMTVAGVIVAIV